MEFFDPHAYIDFMGPRKWVIGASVAACVLSLVLLVYPGPNYGIDFEGGTELQVAFKGAVSSSELRASLEKLGYERPDVVAVANAKNEYLIRVSEVNAVSADQKHKVEAELPKLLQGATVERVAWSPGGDKISMDLSEDVPVDVLESHLKALGVRVRLVTQFGQDKDHRYEAQLVGVADKLISELDAQLGNRGPEAPKRVEWVGPKAGEQLRTAAIQALLYAMAFIMAYVAFRFDLRFAPGGILALLHDVLFTVGIYVVTQKEFNLTIVAALLTVVGFSITDTIVVYDRIRENMGRYRDKSLRELINISTSQTLSRTIITSGTVLLSMTAFFIWGTPVIRDLSFALIVGIMVGTYSSIYIAAPMTEWMDTRFFKKTA